ncbi:MAG: hypothetical protein Kow00117_07690 [Phototrophicales bacterium]
MRRIGLIVVLIGLLMVMQVSAQTVTTLVVTSLTDEGWAIGEFPTGSTPTMAFVTGPGGNPTGTGSFHDAITGTGQKVILGVPYSNQLLSSFTSFAYTINVVSLPQQFYLNVYIDSSANGIGTTASWYDCRYDFVAPGSLTLNSWQTLTITQFTTADNVQNPLGSCTSTLSGLTAGSVIMFTVLNVGDTSDSDIGAEAYFDSVVITTTSGVTVYDFELSDPIIPSSDCILDNRVNNSPIYDCAAPVAVYCDGDNIDVYRINPFTSQGTLLFRATQSEIDAVGIPSVNTIIDNAEDVTLYRLTSGEFQINAFYQTEWKPYVKVWDACPPTYVKHIEPQSPDY